MKKKFLVLSTLVLTFVLSSSVFARDKYDYSMMDNHYNYSKMSNEDHAKMKKFMEDNFDHDMMNNYNGEYKHRRGNCRSTY